MSREFGELLRDARDRRGAPRAALAAGSGISRHTLASYERGVRLPANPATVHRLAAALDLNPDPLLEAAGLPAAADRDALPVRMRDLTALAESYPWPCLLNNENLEAVGMNAPARALAGRDLSALGEPGARHLLRLVLGEDVGTRLKNADTVIGQLAAIIKSDRTDVHGSAQGPRFNASVAAWLVQAPMETRARLFAIWAQVPEWSVGNRVAFTANWETIEGEQLAFHCLVTPWSNLLGIWAFDWHPADGATWDWLAARTHGAPATAGAAPWPQHLADRRLTYGLSRRQFADAAGVSVEAVTTWEKGTRRPSRRNLVALVRANGVDGATAGLVADALGYDPVPSAAYRYLQGETIPERPDLESLDVAPIGPEEIEHGIERHPWPALAVDRQGRIVCANGAARRLLLPTASPRSAAFGSLAELVLSARFRASCANWSACAPALLNFPHTLIPGAQAPARAAEAGAYTRPPGSRALVAFEWRARGTVLPFHCLISPWNIWDPFAAIDFFPASGAAWEWFDRG